MTLALALALALTLTLALALVLTLALVLVLVLTLALVLVLVLTLTLTLTPSLTLMDRVCLAPSQGRYRPAWPPSRTLCEIACRPVRRRRLLMLHVTFDS